MEQLSSKKLGSDFSKPKCKCRITELIVFLLGFGCAIIGILPRSRIQLMDNRLQTNGSTKLLAQSHPKKVTLTNITVSPEPIQNQNAKARKKFTIAERVAQFNGTRLNLISNKSLIGYYQVLDKYFTMSMPSLLRVEIEHTTIVGDPVIFSNISLVGKDLRNCRIQMIPFNREVKCRLLDYEKYTRFICDFYYTAGKLILNCEAAMNGRKMIGNLLENLEKHWKEEVEKGVTDVKIIPEDVMEWRQEAYLGFQKQFNSTIRPYVFNQTCFDKLKFDLPNALMRLQRMEQMQFYHRDLYEKMKIMVNPALEFLENANQKMFGMMAKNNKRKNLS